MKQYKNLSKPVLNMLLILNAYCVFGQDTTLITAKFIGSHGYFIESGSKKIALDAHIYWEGSYWGYIKPTVQIKTDIENAVSPFNDIDLLLISHAHKDHYNTEMIEKSMSKNPNAIIITTKAVFNALQNEAQAFSVFQDRIWVPDIGFYQSIDTTINEIPLMITNSEHGKEKMELLIFSFVLDGLRFVQLNSWNSITGAMYDTLGFNQQRADIAFLGYDYIMNSTKFNSFKNHIAPVFSTISHIDGAGSSKYKSIQHKMSQIKSDYPMNIIYTPGEELVFTKISKPGKYELKIAGIDILGDITDIINLTVSAETLGTACHSKPENLSVFPNPVTGLLQVKIDQITQPYSFILTDLNGKVVKQGTQKNSQIDLSAITKGVYLLKILAENGNLYKKIVIE